MDPIKVWIARNEKPQWFKKRVTVDELDEETEFVYLPPLKRTQSPSWKDRWLKLIQLSFSLEYMLLYKRDIATQRMVDEPVLFVTVTYTKLGPHFTWRTGIGEVDGHRAAQLRLVEIDETSHEIERNATAKEPPHKHHFTFEMPYSVLEKYIVLQDGEGTDPRQVKPLMVHILGPHHNTRSTSVWVDLPGSYLAAFKDILDEASNGTLPQEASA